MKEEAPSGDAAASGSNRRRFASSSRTKALGGDACAMSSVAVIVVPCGDGAIE